MYINSAYYFEYGGREAGEDPPLSVYIQRACDVIDRLTGYKIPGGGGLSNFPTFVQEQVRKATAAQTEYMVLNGLHDGSSTNFSVGSFSVSASGNGRLLASPTALAHLQPTGLLYSGVTVL